MNTLLTKGQIGVPTTIQFYNYICVCQKWSTISSYDCTETLCRTEILRCDRESRQTKFSINVTCKTKAIQKDMKIGV